MKFERPEAHGSLTRLSKDAHLVFLQESLEAMAHASVQGKKTQRIFAPGYRSSTAQTGVEIRSSFPIDVSCTLRFIEPWLRTPKAAAVARLEIRGVKVLAINLHAVNFSFGTADYTAQLDTLGELVAAHTGAVIFGGDLNNWSGKREQRLREFAARHKLKRVVFEPDWRSRHLGRAVDGFLVRDLEVASATAIPSLESDHHPIRLTLRIPAAADSPAPDA
ncbi:MAG: endonuclease/exonuclease/phosphatase family protein [Congregibacter sp.]